jgi:hypothetical protein
MLLAYRQRPTIKCIMDTTGVGKRIARRAITEGWPDHSLPPFVELISGGTSVHKEMAVIRESWEDQAITKGEAARMAAEEAMAARTTMKAAMSAMTLTSKVADELMKRLNNSETMLPEEMTTLNLAQLIKAMDNSASIAKKAMEIERLRAGEPEAVLGIQIGMMLERCNDDELEGVIETGTLPARILDLRRQSMDMLSEQDKVEDSILSANDADGAPIAPETLATPKIVLKPKATPTPHYAKDDFQDLDDEDDYDDEDDDDEDEDEDKAGKLSVERAVTKARPPAKPAIKNKDVLKHRIQERKAKEKEKLTAAKVKEVIKNYPTVKDLAKSQILDEYDEYDDEESALLFAADQMDQPS